MGAGNVSTTDRLETTSGRMKPQLTQKTLLVLGAINLIDCINTNLITPYVVAMVVIILDTTREDPQVAHTVALLLSLKSLLEVCCSVFWGKFADRFGRRPTLLVGLVGSGFATLLCGMGTSLEVVFVGRALQGIFCGNASVSRTYLGEIVDASNEARGFGFLSICFSVGLFIGPMLGGGLVYPARWSPEIFGGTIFEKLPFLLPNLTAACFAGIASVIGMLYLEETLVPNARVRFRGGLVVPPSPPPRGKKCINTTMSFGSDPHGTPSFDSGLPDDTPPNATNGGSGASYPCNLIKILLAFSALSGFSASNLQLFILVVSLPGSVGGFELGPREIGSMQNVAAVVILFMQLCFYPLLTRRLGFTNCFFVGWTIIVIAFSLFPVYGLFADSVKYGCWRYLPLAFMQGFGAVGGSMVYPTAFVSLNRASHGMGRGAVQGWANCLSALCRAVLPPVLSVLFTYGCRLDSSLGRYLATYVNLAVSSTCMAIAFPAFKSIERTDLPAALGATALLAFADNGGDETSGRIELAECSLSKDESLEVGGRISDRVRKNSSRSVMEAAGDATSPVLGPGILASML